MTDSTQEIDEILQKFAMAEQQIGDEMAVGAIQEEDFDVRDTLAREQAKQALIDWHNKQIEKMLDRLEVERDSHDADTGCSDELGYIPLSAIEAERAKLKEE